MFAKGFENPEGKCKRFSSGELRRHHTRQMMAGESACTSPANLQKEKLKNKDMLPN